MIRKKDNRAYLRSVYVAILRRNMRQDVTLQFLGIVSN